MAAKATAPATTPEIDIRWEMANYGRPYRWGKGRQTDSITLFPTKRHDRVSNALEEIAATLVESGVWDEEMQESDDNLADLVGTTWEAIEVLFKAWAARADDRRAAIRAQWAAAEAAKKAEKAGSAGQINRDAAAAGFAATVTG